MSSTLETGHGRAGKVWGALLWLCSQLFFGMEILPDAENGHPQGTEEEQSHAGSLFGATLSSGETTWAGFYQEK